MSKRRVDHWILGLSWDYATFIIMKSNHIKFGQSLVNEFDKQNPVMYACIYVSTYILT